MLPVLMTSKIEKMTDDLIEEVRGDCDSHHQKQLLKQLGNHLSGWETITNISTMNQAKILYHVYMLWEEEVCIKNEVKSEWGGDFYTWARFYTAPSDEEPAKITIDNKIAVFRDYVALGLIEPPETIYIPKRDSRGNIVSDNEEDWLIVEGDFMKVKYTKLLTARGAAKRRELTPEGWTALFDPHCTARQLTSIITQKPRRNQNKQLDNNEDQSDDFRLYEQDGIVYAYQNEQKIELAHLLTENRSNPLWQRGINHLLSSVKVHTPMMYKNDFKQF